MTTPRLPGQDAPADDKSATPALACMGSAPYPDTLASDLIALAELPEAARTQIWEVLGPCLEPELPPGTDGAIDAFCRKYDARGKQVALGVRGARFLLFQAAKTNAEAYAFAADLATLAGDKADILKSVLLEKYPAAKAKIRGDIVKRTIAEHGRMLLNVDWRIDRVMASQHGQALDVPLAVLTLTYAQGPKQSRMTLHADQAILRQLRALCDEMLA